MAADKCRHSEGPERCILAVVRSETHICVDRNGNPTEGTERACWYGSRLEVLADSLAEMADRSLWLAVAEGELCDDDAFRPMADVAVSGRLL